MFIIVSSPGAHAEQIEVPSINEAREALTNLLVEGSQGMDHKDARDYAEITISAAWRRFCDGYAAAAQRFVGDLLIITTRS